MEVKTPLGPHFAQCGSLWVNPGVFILAFILTTGSLLRVRVPQQNIAAARAVDGEFNYNFGSNLGHLVLIITWY